MRLLPPISGKTFDQSFENALHTFRNNKLKLKKEKVAA